ncbi:MAG TPA: PA0069 family radical SAM protein [Sphingorhabdus sp.]|uniref:PA0069 family radical SAM protein n=1 Tax=Sphingorhabdus sp. TaxID=1902408 RepID=UPI002CF8EE3E|nr:PA0069 family radical SAM protein [Sphingorhabdus sp.]HMT41310.1 PA0069 family radical SAM protein [Sphingorhabdus sp.]HMU20981.1 PA0069 family radical SAM protein [Sphingorhabdus sp.]
MAGRGAPANTSPSRFNLNSREADGDWLDERVEIDGGTAPLRTQVTSERPKSILARNTSPDIPFDKSVNPYRGCEHGCIYCYARPTHAYHDMSPGLDFESRLFAKPDAASLLRKEIGRRGHVPTPIAFGTNTDAYQPIEREWRIMRQCLEVLAEANHPLTITTKSDRVLRDLELLVPMAAKGLVAVAVSVTMLDPALHRILEPRAPRPEKRLAAIKELATAGIPTHVNVAPIIPAINDYEIEAILERAAEAGAKTASWIPLRLPHEVAPLFQDWLQVHFPDRAGKVMSIVRSIREGRDNDPNFFQRMRGSGPWADLIRNRFRIAARKAGLNQTRIELRSDLFIPPRCDGQLALF